MIYTDNTQTLVNALARIDALEAELAANAKLFLEDTQKVEAERDKYKTERDAALASQKPVAIAELMQLVYDYADAFHDRIDSIDEVDAVRLKEMKAIQIGIGKEIKDQLAKLYAAASAAPVPEGWREFIEEVSKQKPEKPDYWSMCGQCERNISNAEDLLEAAPKDAS